MDRVGWDRMIQRNILNKFDFSEIPEAFVVPPSPPNKIHMIVRRLIGDLLDNLLGGEKEVFSLICLVCFPNRNK